MKEHLQKQSLLLYDFKKNTLKELVATKVFVYLFQIEKYVLEKYEAKLNKEKLLFEAEVEMKEEKPNIDPDKELQELARSLDK